MKVALIYAKAQNIRDKAAELFSDDSKTAGELARDEIYPPLGISILASWLRDAGHEVRLKDDSIHSLAELDEAAAWSEVVGISSLTPNARRARELGQRYRNEHGKFVVMGGPHPTTNPEYFLESGAADVCVQAEGDQVLTELLAVIDQPEKWDAVQSITFLRDGEQVQTPRRPLMRDMDAVPFPAFDLWDVPRYMKLMVNPCVTVITSRGCPYQCTFCDAEMTPRQYRSMSPERTVDLLQHVIETYDPPQIAFMDDLFTIQRKRVIAICKEIIRRDLFFEWTCESRIDTMDYEMLRWMRKAGCVKVYYGLESGSPQMLVTMKKGVTKEKVVAGAKLNRELGMYFKFFLLYGFPEDTVEDHRLTEELVRETRPDHVCCGILQPIPGTEVYEQLKPVLTKDVTEIDFHYWHATETFQHPTFSFEEMQQERERVLKVHNLATRGIVPRLRRKVERLIAMIRHPELLGDLIEVRRRRKRFRDRVSQGDWAETLQGRKDYVAQQVPKVVLD